jgi:plasmid stabilization system protein ParE
MISTSYIVSVDEEAEEELDDIVGWYLLLSPKTAQEFIEVVDELLEFLSRNPYIYVKQRKNFRTALLRKYPYIIIYEITGNQVLVLRIYHTARNPQKRFTGLKK